MNEEYQRRLQEINARIDRLNQKDERSQLHKTGHEVSTSLHKDEQLRQEVQRSQFKKTGHEVSKSLHKDEQLRQEVQRRQDAAKSTFESVSKNGLRCCIMAV